MYRLMEILLEERKRKRKGINMPWSFCNSMEGLVYRERLEDLNVCNLF